MQGPVSESRDTFFPHPQQANTPARHWPEVLLQSCGLGWVKLSSLCDFLIPEDERLGVAEGLRLEQAHFFFLIPWSHRPPYKIYGHTK